MVLLVLICWGVSGCGDAATAPGASRAAPAPAADRDVDVIVPAGQPSPAVFAWPDPDLTVVTTPHGTAPPVTDWDRESSASIAGSTGEDVDRLVELSRYQGVVGSLFEEVQTRYPQRYSAASQALYDGSPAWVALTGEVPADLVPLAEELPVPVELRGGAALSDAEREAALGPAWELFTAAVEPAGASGGLFAPTAHFTIDYAPTGTARADSGTAAAMADAARAAIGRDVAFTAEFSADERDPTSTEPAVWFLSADALPGPASTSVAVLVDQRACVDDDDPQSGIAEPVVEVTATEVRIAIGALIRKGPQGCAASPLTPLVVDLGQPLGGRVLVDVNGTVDDGSVAPPAQASGEPVVVPRAG